METFDLRESIVAFSLLQICNHFQCMQPGEVVEIITLDAEIAEDIERILPAPTRETILCEQPGAMGTEFRIQLKKLPPNTFNATKKEKKND